MHTHAVGVSMGRRQSIRYFHLYGTCCSFVSAYLSDAYALILCISSYYLYKYIYIYIYIFIVHIHLFVLTYAYTYIRVCMDMCIYTYTNRCTNFRIIIVARSLSNTRCLHSIYRSQNSSVNLTIRYTSLSTPAHMLCPRLRFQVYMASITRKDTCTW